MQNMVNFMLMIAIPIAAGLFAYAGILRFSSNGNTSKVNQSTKIFSSVLIGFAIALSGYLIVQTVLNAFLSQAYNSGGGWNWASLKCEGDRERSSPVGRIFDGLYTPTGGGGVVVGNTPTSPTGVQPNGGTAAPKTCGTNQCTAVGSNNGQTVTYTNPADGSQTALNGGTLAWRTNNPGNMIAGAPGFTPVGYNNGNAVFADYQTGFDAMIANLQTPKYQAQTVAGAVATWCPPSACTNTSGYINTVAAQSGFSASTPLSALTRDQLVQIGNIIQKVEGYGAGTIQTVKK